MWLIEYIGLDPFTSIAILWAIWRGGVVRFSAGNSRALSFWRHHLSPERFDEFESRFAIDAESHWQIFRAVESRTEEIRKSPLFHSLRSFFPEPNLDIVVRKGLIAEGFMELVFRRDTEMFQKEGRPIYFLPRERRPFLEALYPAAQSSVPWGWGGANFIKGFVSRGFLPVYFGVGGIWKLVRNGIAFRLPPPRKWNIASIMRAQFTPASLAFDEIIYGEGDLAPQNILHILQFRATPDYEKYFEDKGITYVFPADLATPIGFLFRRGLRDFVGSLVLRAFVPGKSSDFTRLILRMGLQILETELLTHYHQSKICFGYDCYWVKADLRALIWGRNGGRYIGHMFGMTWLPAYPYQNTVIPFFLCAGQGSVDRYGDTLKHVERVVPAGIVPLDLVSDKSVEQENLRQLGKGNHLIGAFDSTYSPLWGLTHEVFETFYDGLLRLAESFPQITILLKRKYHTSSLRNPGFDRLAKKLSDHPRIVILYDETAYSVLAAVDSVIAITSSTTGWEGLCCRKPTLFFDPRPSAHIHPALRHSSFLVCRTYAALRDRFSDILKGEYLDQNLWNKAVSYEATYFVDEKPAEKLRHFLIEQVGRVTQQGSRS